MYPLVYLTEYILFFFAVSLYLSLPIGLKGQLKKSACDNCH